MKSRIKKVVLATVSIGLIGGAAFWSYKYSNEIRDFFSPWYSDTYTLEEVNSKISSLQKKAVEEMLDVYTDQLESWGAGNINGSIDISASWNSSFWWGNMSASLESLDVQYDESGANIEIKGLSGSWELQVFWEKAWWNIALELLDIITNASWSYVQAKDIVLNLPDGSDQLLSPELIMTLNTLWDGDKYIDLSENIFYNILKAGLDSQKNNTK